MKKSKSLLVVLASSFLVAGALLGIEPKYLSAEGYSSSTLPTTISLKDSLPNEIQGYYKNLNDLDPSERQGTNLLKNLKEILKDGQKYYSYDSGKAIWQIYEIADRDWIKSPAGSDTYGTYNSSEEKITNYQYGTSASTSKNNPYIHALYVNRDVENQVTAWDDHDQDQWGINREHIWAKAHGFPEKIGKDETGRGPGVAGDPLHLWAANGYANNIHSDNYYGYVNTSKTYIDCGDEHTTSKGTFTWSNLSGNLRGISKTKGVGTVFEPQDCDKGDIARAIFYMVARYNFLSGEDSDGIDVNNPNLEIIDESDDTESGSYVATETLTGKMGVLTDLLAWHHADPVDQYEIHRNNLLYKNYTNNRNPFIDYPEWADYIWGTVVYNGNTKVSYDNTPTGYAQPNSDVINGYRDSGETISVTGVTLDKNSLTIEIGDRETLTAAVAPNNATNKNVTWTSNNTNIATVSNGVVRGIAEGNATITVTTNDGNFTATCNVTVNPDSGGEVGEQTVTTNVGTYASNHSWTNGTKYNVIDLDKVVTASTSSGGNNGRYYDTSAPNEWRFYQTNNGVVTISAAEGYELESVTFTFNSTNNGVLLDSGSNPLTSGVAKTISGSSVSFSVGNSEPSGTGGQIRITEISVTYQPIQVATSIEATVNRSFYVGETIAKSDITVTDNLGNNIDDFEFENYTFTYEDTEGGNIGSEIDFDIEYNGMETTLTVNVLRRAYATPEEVDDVITYNTINISGNSYVNWDGITVTSDAVYKGNSAGGNTSIQLRSGTSNNSDQHSGIVSKVSGGYATKVSISWNSNSNNSRGIIVYGKDTAYTDPNDLYDPSLRGTSLGTLIKTNGTELILSELHSYIGITSSDGAIYIDEISITYVTTIDTAESLANFIMYEDVENQCVTKFNDAKDIFNGLTKAERSTFMTSNDYVILTARERLEAWARNRGKIIEHENNDYVLKTIKRPIVLPTVMDDNPGLLVTILISGLSILGLGLYLYKKRRQFDK